MSKIATKVEVWKTPEGYTFDTYEDVELHVLERSIKEIWRSTEIVRRSNPDKPSFFEPFWVLERPQELQRLLEQYLARPDLQEKFRRAVELPGCSPPPLEFPK